MTENEVLALSRKIDSVIDTVGETNKIVSDTRVQVKEVSVNLTAHIERDGERKEERELTCPVRPAVEQLTNDVNAIGGTLRTVRTDVEDLKSWRKQEDKDDIIIAARVGPLQALGRGLVTNANSVIMALAIAYLLILLRMK